MAWFFTRPEVIGRAELLDRPDSAGKCSLQPVWRLLAVQGDDIDAWLASQAAAEAKARGGKPAPTFANVAAGAPANDEPGNDDVQAVTP